MADKADASKARVVAQMEEVFQKAFRDLQTKPILLPNYVVIPTQAFERARVEVDGMIKVRLGEDKKVIAEHLQKTEGLTGQLEDEGSIEEFQKKRQDFLRLLAEIESIDKKLWQNKDDQAGLKVERKSIEEQLQQNNEDLVRLKEEKKSLEEQRQKANEDLSRVEDDLDRIEFRARQKTNEVMELKKGHEKFVEQRLQETEDLKRQILDTYERTCVSEIMKAAKFDGINPLVGEKRTAPEATRNPKKRKHTNHESDLPFPML